MAIEAEASTDQPGYGEFQTRNGARMGFVSQGAGTPVILMHGSLCDFRYWEPQIDAIAKSHLCIAPSMTHYWPNPLPGQTHRFSWDRHVDELAELIAVEASGRAHIVGHSRGGHVAFQLAVRYPMLVRTLTLADPAGTIEFGRSTPPTLPHAVNALRARSAALIGIGEREQGLRLFVDSVSRPGFWDRSTDEFKEMAFANAHTLALQFADPLQPYSAESAATIRCPTLIIDGQRSPRMFRRNAEALACWIRDAQRETLAGASHGMNVANPAGFNRALLAFISKAESAA